MDLESLISFSFVLIFGFCSGIASFFYEDSNKEIDSNDTKKLVYMAVKTVFISTFLCACVYMILGYFALDFQVRIGFGALAGFLGVETLIGILERILRLKGQK